MNAIQVPVKGATYARRLTSAEPLYCSGMEGSGSIRSRVGKRVQALRLAAGLTQDDLASRARVARGYLSEVERGLSTPSLETLEQIGEALDKPVTAFLSDESTPRRNKPDGAARLGQKIAVLAQDAPDVDRLRFERLARTYFAEFRPRRKRR